MCPRAGWPFQARDDPLLNSSRCAIGTRLAKLPARHLGLASLRVGSAGRSNESPHIGSVHKYRLQLLGCGVAAAAAADDDDDDDDGHGDEQDDAGGDDEEEEEDYVDYDDGR